MNTTTDNSTDTAQQLLNSIAPQCDLGHPGPWAKAGRKPCTRTADYSLMVHHCDHKEDQPAMWCAYHLNNIRSGVTLVLASLGHFHCRPCSETFTSTEQILHTITPLR